MKCDTLFFAALLAATPGLCAQGDKKQDPAAAEMPNPKHPEHDALKALVGSWDCVMKTEAMPGVPGMEEATESKGTEHAELVCNGLWLKSTVNAQWKGEPFSGLWIAGYDPYKKTYTSVWVCSDESQGGGACVMDGTYDEGAKTWTWTGMTPHGETRSVYAFKGQDQVVETCYMKTPDGKEAKCMEITRKRTSATAKAPIVADASAKVPEDLSAEQAALHKAAGEWDATVKSSHEGQPATEDKGAERVTAICNGRWLWSDFKSTFHGQPFEGHALFGYDPTTKECVSFWFDSMSPVAAQTRGPFDASQKTCKLEGNSVCPLGTPLTIKESVTWKDDNTRVMQMEFKGEDANGKMEITYHRKAKK